MPEDPTLKEFEQARALQVQPRVEGRPCWLEPWNVATRLQLWSCHIPACRCSRPVPPTYSLRGPPAMQLILLSLHLH